MMMMMMMQTTKSVLTRGTKQPRRCKLRSRSTYTSELTSNFYMHA